MKRRLLSAVMVISLTAASLSGCSSSQAPETGIERINYDKKMFRISRKQGEKMQRQRKGKHIQLPPL
jgi:hypothetical protein